MKKIWYLKDEYGQNVKAVKLFLYEKEGHILGKMDLSAFRKEGSLAGQNMVLVIQDANNRELGTMDLSDRQIIRESFLEGKGRLKEELAHKIGAVRGEVRLSVTIGEKRYFSEGWQAQEASISTESQNKEKTMAGKTIAEKTMEEKIMEEKIMEEKIMEEETMSAESKAGFTGSRRRNRAFHDEKAGQTEKIEAEELLTEETGGRRIVQLATLEDELEFRSYVHNSFLLHGYYNYGHVIIDETGEEPRLGVPGNYYEREQMVAAMFGFPDFEPAREGERVSSGTFGYFYTKGKR